jgi:hypothetical protein
MMQTRRQFVRGVGVAGLGLLAGCGIGAPQPEPPDRVSRIRVLPPENPTPPPAKSLEEIQPPARDHLAVDILGGHDTPNPGGSRDIQQFISDLKTLGMTTAVCIDPSLQIVEALNQAGIRLIVRLVQEHNVFDERNIMWTINKLKGVHGVSFQPFNEPNIEGADVSPEDHIRDHFMSAARVILPIIAPHGGTLLLTPLAPYARFQGSDELDAYRRMLTVLRDELTGEDDWMWKHIEICAHAYSYYIGDARIWNRLEQLHKITNEVTGSAVPIEITEAGLNIDYQDQYTDTQIMQETVRILKSPIPPPLRGSVRSFCLWLTANYAQRDQWHQRLGADQEKRQLELERFEIAALRRLDGVTPTYQAIANITATASVPSPQEAGS